MRHEKLTWKTSDDIEIYGQYWLPDEEPKAAICIVHGMGEHSGRYGYLVEYLISKGFAAISYDQRGHGKSGGKRGHTPSYDLLLDGVDDLLGKANEHFGEIPKFIFGHSMGGNVILNYALRRKPKVNGVIAASPWLKLAFEPPKIKVSLGKLVNSFWPSFTQATELEHEHISREAGEVERYMNDELIHDKISSNMFISLYEAGLWALEHVDGISLPLLIYHGTGDQLTSYDATEEFASKIEKDVAFKHWDGYYHECHNDKGREDVFKYINAWLEAQLEPSAEE